MDRILYKMMFLPLQKNGVLPPLHGHLDAQARVVPRTTTQDSTSFTCRGLVPGVLLRSTLRLWFLPLQTCTHQTQFKRGFTPHT
ncbi:hypothetical protein Trydic_g16676 [Trypoxylus dichotomus]